MTTAVLGAFAKFVAALCTVVMTYRTWRKEESKAKEEKKQKEDES